MKKFAMVLSCLLAPFSVAHAAGVSKALKFSVNDSALAGYAATPPTGWRQAFSIGAATPGSAPVQRFFALTNAVPAGAATVPPPRTALTILGPSGGVLSKEILPAAVQVVALECKFPPGNACPSLSTSASLSTALPGRLIVMAFKQTFTPPMAYGMKYWMYAVDPAAPIGSADRWVLLTTASTTGTDLTSLNGLLNAYGRGPDVNFYVFGRSATATQVLQVVNK